jgi:hypothetical protein
VILWSLGPKRHNFFTHSYQVQRKTSWKLLGKRDPAVYNLRVILRLNYQNKTENGKVKTTDFKESEGSPGPSVFQ